MVLNKNNIFFLPILKFFLSFLFIFSIVSCSKSPIRVVNPPVTPPVDSTFENGIFVVNEGGYLHGNASITFINSKGIVDQNLYSTQNNGRSLGDVAESMQAFKDSGFIIVNNSDKIVIVSLKNFNSVKAINDGNSPRFMAIVDSTKAYVTNMQDDISVINLSTLEIEKSIHTGTWTESLIKYNNYMFVTSIGLMRAATDNRDANILVINVKTDQIVDSIKTGKEPVSMVIDKKDKIWVLCTGGYDHYELPTLVRIDPTLMIVDKTFSFPSINDSPSRLCINALKDTLYYLNNGIYQMPVAMTSIPASPLIPANGHNYYGLGIHPVSGNIFATDVKDYAQEGTIYQYNQISGSLIKTYQAGIIPGTFCFLSGSGKK